MSLFRAIAAIVIYLGAFVFFGSLLPERWHKWKFINLILLGFPAYFGLFQIISLPLKLLDVSLKTVSIAWLAVLGIVFFAVLILRRKQFFPCLKKSITEYRADLYGIVWIVLVIGMLAALAGNTTHLSGYDYSYYVGTPVASVYGNTIENIDVYTGEWGNVSQRNYYILNTFSEHSAVIYQLFDLHPVMEAEVTLTVLMPLLFLLFLYKTGFLLFKEDPVLAKMFAAAAVLVLFFSYAIAGSSMYFAYRPYEGKAVCSYLIPAAVFCFFVMIMKESEAEGGWGGAFLTSVAGIAFTNSALFIVPGMTAMLGIPYLFTHHDRKTIRNACIVLIPSVIWFLLHTLL